MSPVFPEFDLMRIALSPSTITLSVNVMSFTVLSNGSERTVWISNQLTALASNRSNRQPMATVAVQSTDFNVRAAGDCNAVILVPNF
jgi:hypothetical protein